MSQENSYFLAKDLCFRKKKIEWERTIIVKSQGTLFSSVQSLDKLGRQGNMRDDSAESLFQSFLQEARASSSGIGRGMFTLCCCPSNIFSADHGVAHRLQCPEGRFWRGCCGVSCPNHASFPISTVNRRGSCAPTRKPI